MTFHRFARLSFIGACLPTVCGFFAKLDWRCDLMTHFVVQSAVVGGLYLAAFLAWRDWKSATAAALLLVINTARILPFFMPATEIAPSGSGVRIVSANVHSANDSPERFLSFIQDEDPDVVLAMEVNERWIAALSPLRSRYPHYIESPRSDNFGVAFYSRKPTDLLKLVELAESRVPTVVARLRCDGRQITFFGAHLLPPINRRLSGIRNAQLRSLGEMVRTETTPVVVMGDLNITSWSPWFAELQRPGALVDTRGGFGLCASWPASNRLLAIPIDHVLVSRGFQVVSRRLGADIGSDHRPIVAEIAATGAGD